MGIDLALRVLGLISGDTKRRLTKLVAILVALFV